MINQEKMLPFEITFILYKPAVPGNIGACARAIKTMGFESLRLIQPADHLSEEAFMMAHGSGDILEKSQVFDSFGEAVQDLDFIVSTTAKRKGGKVDYLPASELGKMLLEKGHTVKHAGIVFGSEESGLPNDVLLQSNIGVTIPMAVEYPSLNLSQAVMVLAYELAKAGMVERPDRETGENQQEEASWKELHERTSWLLEIAGIDKGTPLYHRIIERMSFLKASDARLAHSVSSKLAGLLKK